MLIIKSVVPCCNANILANLYIFSKKASKKKSKAIIMAFDFFFTRFFAENI